MPKRLYLLPSRCEMAVLNSLALSWSDYGMKMGNPCHGA